MNELPDRAGQDAPGQQAARLDFEVHDNQYEAIVRSLVGEGREEILGSIDRGLAHADPLLKADFEGMAKRTFRRMMLRALGDDAEFADVPNLPENPEVAS